MPPTGVTNGLFTVTLDFGNVFNGNPLFLEIGVRTNGSTAAYAILSPTQPVTPTPYAVLALSTAAFSGAIGDNQLSANVPLLNGNPVFSGHAAFTNATGTFSGAFSGTFTGTGTGFFNGTNTGTFIGNGANVSNVNITNVVGIVQSNPNWQLIQSTAQQAVAGNNYVTTNAAQTTLVLPANASVGTGTTIQISGSGQGGWVLSPNSGQSILTATLGLPAGQNWTSQAPASTFWRTLACSADGTRLAAGVAFGVGPIDYSTNGGLTWLTSDAPSLSWMGIAASSDGLRMIAVPSGNNVYTSTNGGANWTKQTGSANTSYTCVASSANGLNLAAAGSGLNNIFTSTNGGTNWVARTTVPTASWTGIASSADGTRLAACATGASLIFTSKDSGATWASNGPLASWSCIASSADGSKLVAAVGSGGGTGNIFISGDGGVSWTPRAASQSWTCVCSSSNGYNLAAAFGTSGFIFTSSDAGQSWIARTNGISPLGQNWTALASSASGSSLFGAVENGHIFNSIAATTIGSGSLVGSQFAVLGLQYVGNGLWIPLTSIGSFTGF